MGPDGARHRLYVLHRAIFGSLERFFAILLEHYGGAFPLWLAPVQAKVLPVGERHRECARAVKGRLQEVGLRAEIDERSEPLSARVRDGEREKIPFLVVIGDREAAEDKVSVRRRGSGELQTLALPEWLAQLEVTKSPSRTA